jgi:outer membrane protein
MKTMKLALATSLVLAAAVAAPAHAGGAGTWEFKIGAHNVNPKSDNGTLRAGAAAFDVEVGSNTRPTFGFGSWLTDHLQLDLLAAIPFEHEVKLNGARAADFKHLPPTLTLQYHFNPGGDVCPFVGVGVNYTYVYSEAETGPLTGTRLDLDNSFGLAAQVGIEFKLNDRWSLAGDVRWFDIDSDAKLNGASLGTVAVDPIGVGIFAVYSF